jgi:hypothetical protein
MGIQLTTPTSYLNGDFLILMRVIIHLNERDVWIFNKYKNFCRFLVWLEEW